MTKATVNSRNFLAEKGKAMITARIPEDMKTLIQQAAAGQNMTSSNYIKMALQERLERDSIN